MNPLKPIAPLLFIVLPLLATNEVQAQQIYKWIDANGRVHYGAKKPENADQTQLLDIVPTSVAPTSTSDSAAEIARINALTERMASERRAIEEARQAQALRELEQENERLKNDLLRERNQKNEESTKNVILYPPPPGFHPPYGPNPLRPQPPTPYPCQPWPDCQRPPPPTARPEPAPPNKPDRVIFNPKPVGVNKTPSNEGFRP